MNKQSTVIDIASDAIEHLEVTLERLAWLDSMAWAIRTEIEKGNSHHAKHLACAAQYLAGDCRNLFDGEVARLNQRIETLELGG